MNKSVLEGNRLAERALGAGIQVNPEFGGTHISSEVKGTVIDGLAIRILAPSPSRLGELRGYWQRKTWDNSVTNRSGIAFIAEFRGRRVFFTGDARGDDLLDALTACGILDENNRLHVDLLSVPHHGATPSNIEGFLSQVTASIYVISAGHRERHPGLETLLHIADDIERQQRGALILTNETATVAQFKEQQPLHAARSGLRILPPASHFFTVTLA